MYALLSFVLVVDVVEKIFDVLVLHYLLLEEIFPHFIELQLPCLYLAVDRLVQVDPEFFQKFQAISQLDVWPQNHIKHFFVFYRTINEFLKSFSWLPYIFPSCLSPFRTDIFIILGIIDIEFLLLLVSDIYTAEVVSVRLLTLSIGVSPCVLIC